jgi:hypothetical protein
MATKDKQQNKFSFRLSNQLLVAVKKYLKEHPETTFSILIRMALRTFLGVE